MHCIQFSTFQLLWLHTSFLLFQLCQFTNPHQTHVSISKETWAINESGSGRPTCFRSDADLTWYLVGVKIFTIRQDTVKHQSVVIVVKTSRLKFRHIFSFLNNIHSIYFVEWRYIDECMKFGKFNEKSIEKLGKWLFSSLNPMLPRCSMLARYASHALDGTRIGEI